MLWESGREEVSYIEMVKKGTWRTVCLCVSTDFVLRLVEEVMAMVVQRETKKI